MQPVLEKKLVIHPTGGDAEVAMILFWLKLYVALGIFLFVFILNTGEYLTLPQICNCEVCKFRNKQKKKEVFFQSWIDLRVFKCQTCYTSMS